MTDSKGTFPLPKYRKPAKQTGNGRRAIKKELDALQKTIDSNTLLIEILQRNMAATEEAHNLHIAALSNFLGHDMKNCIQNMDVILTSYRADEITEGHLESLRVQLDMIREVMGNFAQLVPHGRDGIFKVNSLIGATEALTRSMLEENGVLFTKELLEDIDLRTKYPFHSLLQVFSNLIINACRHLRDFERREVLFAVDIDQENHELFFSVYDTGAAVEQICLDKIFDYGYSTTEGSGIGLYHARYICELLKGTVECVPSDRAEYSKRFLITLPFIGLDDV